jgi:NAD(P)-dependent dehydrogenase (short-subunit alcohol dehydrogenase family)
MSQEKVALITGAAGGIGSEVARRLHRQGYQLTLVDIDAAGLECLAEDLPGAIPVVLDCSDRNALAELVEQIKARFERIDVAFINAGIVFPGEVIALSTGDIDLQLEVNLRSAIHLIKACAEHMVERGSGHIVATVSIGGILALKGNATYAATKFGLRGFLNCLRDELLSKNVQVSGIYPSGVDTPMLRYEACNGGSALNFVGHPQSVQDVGNAFEYALRSKQLEIYVPYFDGVLSRFFALFPWSLHWFYPLMEWIGERGRRKYIRQMPDAATDSNVDTY